MKNIFLLGLLSIVTIVNAQDFQWVKKFDTKAAKSFPYTRLKVDAQNNIIFSGVLKDSIDFDLGPGVYSLVPSGNINKDIFIAKYNSAGNLLWAKKIACNDWTAVWDMTIDNSNNIILSGFINDIVDMNPAVGVSNIGTLNVRTSFIAKYTSTGNFSWVKTYNQNAFISQIETTTQGKIIAAGEFYYTVDFDPGNSTFNLTTPATSTQLFLTQLNSTGTFSWVKKIGSDNTITSKALDLYLDTLNNIYISGDFHGKMDVDPSNNEVLLNSQDKAIGFFAKYNSSGNYVVAQSFFCTGDSKINNIRTDKKGNIILTGRFLGTLDLDASAANVNVSAVGTYDIFVTKYTSSGNFKWGFDIGNASEELLSNHEVSVNGNIYIFGRFKGIVDFNPSTATNNLTSAPTSQPDLFFVSYDSTGKFLKNQLLGGTKVENPYSFILNKNGELLLFGNFSGNVDFNWNSGVANLQASDEDFFLVKYSFSSNVQRNEELSDFINDSTASISLKNSFIIFPNPVNTQLNIKMLDVKIESIKIFNIQGLNIFSQTVNSPDHIYTLNVEDLKSGTYILQVNNQFRQTFIKR